MSQPTFKPGAVVQVQRPGRSQHGWVGRFIELAADPTGFAWVAFGLAGAVYGPPDERIYRKQDKTLRKLLPLSQLQFHES